jgi:hypothetical protein
VIRRFPSRLQVCSVVLAFALPGIAAHALERVTLTNGFTYDCSRHERVDGEHVRLFLLSSDGSQSENYIDRPANEIVGFETMPDPPKAIAPASPTVSAEKPAALDIPALLVHAGAEHQIEVELLASVIKAESNFRVDAVSRAGARGLMQLMPGTAREQGVQDVNRADQNIAGGTAYLDSLLKLYKNDVTLALAAYNAGPAAVARYHGVPPYRETRAYVNSVIREFNRRMAAHGDTVVASR